MNDEVKERLDDHEKRISKIERSMKIKPDIKPEDMTIEEFVEHKKPRNAEQRVLAVAYYLENVTNISPINIEDLKTALMQAKEKVPQSLSAAAESNVSSGYFMKLKFKKDMLTAYKITNKGEEYVEKGFKKKGLFG
jgi:hypothetical protein